MRYPVNAGLVSRGMPVKTLGPAGNKGAPPLLVVRGYPRRPLLLASLEWSDSNSSLLSSLEWSDTKVYEP